MDYKKIIEQLDDNLVIDLMSKLGCDRYIDKSNYIIFPTICHNIDSSQASMKLYYYKDTKLFVCYTSCDNMSIFNLLKHYYQTRQIEYDWYDDIYKVVLNCSNFKERDFEVSEYKSIKSKYERIKKEKVLKPYPKGVLDCFTKFRAPEWLNDGITEEAMSKFDILYSISQNKIVIPHYDVNGNLVGIRGRALDTWEIENVGKYLPIRIEKTWYKHPLSLNLYGLNHTKENIKKSGICFLFEGEKSVLQMENFSRLNCGVAVCGSNFNKYQLNILMKECSPKEIVICFDKEELPKSNKYFHKLYSIGNKYKNYCNFSFIYDWDGLLEMKQSPTDKGEVIFNKLLEKRVKVK